MNHFFPRFFFIGVAAKLMEVPLVTLNYVVPGCFGSELMQKQNWSSELERISISCRGYFLEVANWGIESSWSYIWEILWKHQIFQSMDREFDGR